MSELSELAYRIKLQQRALARPELSAASRKFHTDAAIRIAAQIFAASMAVVER
jgi:hypothetical protein